MRQAIETEYRGPTNSNGSRIIAKCQGKRITVPYESTLDTDDNYIHAALQLADKMEWYGVWVGGGKANGHGAAFVHVPATVHPIKSLKGYGFVSRKGGGHRA